MKQLIQVPLIFTTILQFKPYFLKVSFFLSGQARLKATEEYNPLFLRMILYDSFQQFVC